jgi:hypothetical protein
MTHALWKFEHSVECGVPRDFAWEYWTKTDNWYDPRAKFEFNGPFAVGTRITTILPELRLQSVIRSMEAGREATIEMAYGAATISFRWRFEEIAAGRTAISQTIELSGTADKTVLDEAKVFEGSVPQGMRRIQARIEEAWR